MWPHILLDAKFARLRASRTRQREEVFKALAVLQPCTQVQLIRYLEGQVSHVTIIKTLNLFLKAGVTFRPEGKLIYLAPEFFQHRHVKKCIKCGREYPYRDDRVEREIKRVTGGFRAIGHVLTIVGTCNPACPPRPQ